MPKLPQIISDFIAKHHVVNFAAHTTNDFWTASCFYAFDLERSRLIILSSKNTRHAQLMRQNPHIVGTICDQIEKITDIEGVQFSATCRCLEEVQERELALQCYYKRHPIARLKLTDVWEIRFELIKYTSNQFAFAQKTIWERTSDA